MARRSDSATRRAARAASTEPPQTTGLVSASAMASILAGLTARSRCGEQAMATSSSAAATSSASVRGPRSTWSQELQHHHGGGELVAGARRAGSCVQRPAACSATRESGGQATTTWAAAAYRLARPRTRRPWSEPSGASITTRSRLPAQPGRPGPGQATNGTGHHGSSTARSSRESGPAATPRGGGCPRLRSTPPRRSAPRPPRPPRAVPGRRTRPGCAARGSAAPRTPLVVEPGLVEPGGHRASGRLAGLVDQQHRDVVADRVG